MKINLYVVLILGVFICSGCSQVFSVLTRFVNIDSIKNELELEFDFKNGYKDEPIYVREIEIVRNDSLLCRLNNMVDTAITSWKFPSVPSGFKMDSSIAGNAIPILAKKDYVTFYFRGEGENGCASYGEWKYNPNYSTEEGRWMFDETGNQRIRLDCYYERWVGKDIIKIETLDDFLVDESSFSLTKQDGEIVEFKLKYKRNPTNILALVLEKGQDKGDLLSIQFALDSLRVFSDQVVVPGKSQIGLLGKYNDL
ncbi:MAG: hypothetical protein P1U56_03055 [Saprospiraceae bacterium]|nr:hypothetical protein [Saprospiraceae bacterium]